MARHNHNYVNLKFFEGDTLPVVYGEILEDDDTTPIDITDWTITLHINYRVTPLVKVATIYDATNGLFRFEWEVGDLRAGEYLAEVQIVNNVGEIQTSNSDVDDNILNFIITKQIA